MRDAIEQLKGLRRISTPLVALATADQDAFERRLADSLNGAPKVRWDCAAGFRPVGEAGKEALLTLGSLDDVAAVREFPDMCAAAQRLPEETVVVAHNAHRFLERVEALQGVLNLRDAFKANQRMLVMLAPAFTLPVELQPHVVLVEEALPNEAQLEAIVRRVYEDAEKQSTKGMFPLDGKDVASLVDASRGLTPYTAEQVCFENISPRGWDVEGAWERKRHLVNQTDGLKFLTGTHTLKDVGGLKGIGDFLMRIASGPARIRAFVLIDELEKFLQGSGAGGDSSGTSGDQLGVILRSMTDNRWDGAIFYGIPGGGKTFLAQAIGNELGIPALSFDMGAMKDRWVGSSEARIRNAMRVLEAIAGDGAYFMATCNGLATIPSEFQRRFLSETWFFDLPTAPERLAIWKVQLKAFGHPEEWLKKLPRAEGWTGADVMKCCRGAWRLQCSLEEAARFVRPFSVKHPEVVQNLRGAADGRFFSAASGEIYEVEKTGATGGRRIAN